MNCRRRYLFACIVFCGCSHPSSVSSTRSIIAKVPSEETTEAISFNPTVIQTRSRSGQSTLWVPSRFQSDGEEKLIFDRLRTTPTITGASRKDLPSITIGGDPGDARAFQTMVETFQTCVSRQEFPIADFGLGPFGLTSDLYFGHTFWDMDVWMMPAMTLLAPDAARAAASYRVRRSRQASLNYVEWARSQKRSFETGGMKFPWESSVSGKEACLQKTRGQEHISGDVVWGLTQAEAFGYVDPVQVRRIAQGVRTYYAARSVSTNHGREIRGVISPNEKFEGDNDLYTNLLAEWVTDDRQWRSTNVYYLPRDETSLLNYDHDPMRDYQQAAGLLAIFPLQAPVAEVEARSMMERFSDKISPNGPAMGHAVVATIWARLGESEKAYSAWLESWKPYLHGPNQLFSERRNAYRPYFLTGAAGAINTVVYGFVGLRVDRQPLPGAKWTKRLKSGWWLSIKPCVPQKIGVINLTRIRIDGQRFNFRMTSAGEFSVQTVDKTTP